MILDKKWIRLYLVTDRTWLREGEPLSHRVELALQAGATMVQYREKHLKGDAYIEEAREVQAVCRRYGVPFLLNDNVELARELDADGVHVGLEDMAVEKAVSILGPDKLVGASAHNVEEALAAQRSGASYLGCGAVFGSSTKTNASFLERKILEDICRAVHIPVAAIGGITAENIHELYGCGADGVAVVSAVFAREDPREAVKFLLTEVSRLCCL
ncbi:MAG: thiamine phosphate synthase [Eubacteriales bacterium]|nr:thiamine phosphate synthase [Eubacteriales bacterium]